MTYDSLRKNELIFNVKGWITQFFTGLRSLFLPTAEIHETMVDTDVLADQIVEKTEQRRKYEESRTISFSECGTAKCTEFLGSRKMITMLKEDETTVNVCFEPFTWIADEETDIPRARTHLIKQLKKYGVKFQKDEFYIYDCHLYKNLLRVKDKKLGHLKGGTDLVVAPFGMELSCCIQRACVIFELKKWEKGIEAKNFSQATLELITASYISEFPVIAVLTDLRTEAHVYSMKNSTIIDHIKMSLAQMGQFVCNHMKLGNYNNVEYKLEQTVEDSTAKKRPKAETASIEFRKKFRSADDLLFDQFQDLLDITERGTNERQEVVQQYFGLLFQNEDES